MPRVKSPLEIIPGIGPSLARDLEDLGYSRAEALRGEDPEAMYRRLNQLRGTRIDRCVLYAFRCAVYFAETVNPDPRLLKWWNWKDAALSETTSPSREHP